MENNSKYKLLEYWNQRYETEESFEWFGEYEKYKEIIRSQVSTNDRILVLGCGNSKMSEDMYLDNYRNIVNTDYSPVIVELMKKRCQHLVDMSWVIMDINNILYENESFECVLEKGTIDALLVDEKSPWQLSEEGANKIDNILQKISSILKKNGKFISITFAQPHFRKLIYAKDKYDWSISQFTIGETFHYFVYVMTKGEKISENDKKFYCRKDINAKIDDVNFLSLEENFDENYLFKIES